MKVLKACLIGLVVTWLVACETGVDPEGRFTIRGYAYEASGEPAVFETVHILKREEALPEDEQRFLDYPEPLRDLTGFRTWETVTDRYGYFEYALPGTAINREFGWGAGLMAVMLGGDAGRFSATASDWHTFSDADPIWDVGELHLWSGPDVYSTRDRLVFDWSDALLWDHSMYRNPFGVFAYDRGDNHLRWASLTHDTEVEMPLTAFDGRDVEYFVTGFSSRRNDSRVFQHRTAMKRERIPRYRSSDRLAQGWPAAWVVDDTGAHRASGRVTDGSLRHAAELSGARALMIDLGYVASVDQILIHNLLVSRLDRAIVVLEISDVDASLSPMDARDWIEVDHYEGRSYDENWLYLAHDLPVSARWLRIRVESPSGEARLQAVDEVRVLGDTLVTE